MGDLSRDVKLRIKSAARRLNVEKDKEDAYADAMTKLLEGDDPMKTVNSLMNKLHDK